MRPDEESTQIYVKTSHKTLSQQAGATLAVHDERLDRLEDDVREMKEDMRAVRQILAQAQIPETLRVPRSPTTSKA
jgi:hypothetical protein